MLRLNFPWLLHRPGTVCTHPSKAGAIPWVHYRFRTTFILLPHKKEKFIRLVKEILPRHCLDLLTLQRLSGKSMSMSLAVPGARLYVNEINLAISGATRSSRPVKMSPALRKEIEHWLFLASWDGFLPWRSEKHTHVKLFSDSSHFAWGGALSPNAVEVNVYDYWDARSISLQKRPWL